MDIANYKTIFTVEETHWWYVVRRLFIVDLLRRYASDARNILEIGCGAGATLRYLQRQGYNVTGVDVSDVALQFSRERGISNLKKANAELLPFSDQTFDAVLMLDVLEHVDQDALALQEAYRVLKKNGVLIVFVPAFKFLWGRQDRLSHHLRRYTLPHLLSIFPREAALEKKTYFNFLLFPLIAVSRLIIERLSLRLPEENELNNYYVNKLLLLVFRTELPWLRFFLFRLEYQQRSLFVK